MKREDVIKLMRHLDLIDFRDGDEDEHVAKLIDTVHLIIEKAVAEEKAKCISDCEEVSRNSGGDKYDMFGNDLAEQCVSAIRARKDNT